MIPRVNYSTDSTCSLDSDPREITVHAQTSSQSSRTCRGTPEATRPSPSWSAAVRPPRCTPRRRPPTCPPLAPAWSQPTSRAPPAPPVQRPARARARRVGLWLCTRHAASGGARGAAARLVRVRVRVRVRARARARARVRARLRLEAQPLAALLRCEELLRQPLVVAPQRH